ncbi:MAG: polyprenyl synthetase family protein [Holophaga sp.]|nr:polyprenyl synthetase family protein [Holophaga sp.]
MNILYDHSIAIAFGAGLPLPAALDPRFEGALRHILDHPGNLVRPRMVMQGAMAHGLDAGRAKDLAIALEYFHTASLVFDDLPCMDDASQRRGAPCVHRVYGEGEAILAALALINRAYALIWRAAAGAPPERQAEAMSYVEQRLGVAGLLNGQSLDLHYAALPHDPETTGRIARGKTVSLVRLTLVLPAILGGAGGREIQLQERVSLYWGLAYQILDDLKDLFLGAPESGKTVGRDTLLDRPNLAAVAGPPAAMKRLKRLLRLGDRNLASLLKARPSLAFLRQLRLALEEELDRVTRAAREGMGEARPCCF